MNWLARILGRHSRGEGRITPETLNDALDVALEWGSSLSPIQARLRPLHPELDELQLDSLNDTCQAAIRFGHETALALSATVDDSLKDRFALAFAQRYPWANKENQERIYRHSIYYATKTARVRLTGANGGFTNVIDNLKDMQRPADSNHGN